MNLNIIFFQIFFANQRKYRYIPRPTQLDETNEKLFFKATLIKLNTISLLRRFLMRSEEFLRNFEFNKTENPRWFISNPCTATHICTEYTVLKIIKLIVAHLSVFYADWTDSLLWVRINHFKFTRRAKFFTIFYIMNRFVNN